MFWKVLLTVVAIAVAAVAVLAAMVVPALGRAPRGERLERIMRSKHWREGQFRNLTETTVGGSAKGPSKTVWKFLTMDKPRDRRPDAPVEAVRTDLNAIDRTKDQMVWFGHSSYLLVIGGRTFLVDPVLAPTFPFTLVMRPFEGTDIYSPDDLPAVDFLIITHDHYDHLDYRTVTSIRERVGHVFCPLGVGEHLEYWGYDARKITEMDWDESAAIDVRLSARNRITCLPSRHFSGRALSRNNTLWASFMVEWGGRTVFIGGDGGYDSHFADIGRRFPCIDLAVMENGQYNERWRQIHTLPTQLPLAIHDLGAKLVQPVHNSRFALALHPWDEPMRLIREAARADTTIHLLGATIGTATEF